MGISSRSCTCIVVIFFQIVFIGSRVCKATITSNDLIYKALIAKKKGDFTGAEELLIKAVRMSKQEKSDNVIRGITELAKLYVDTGDYNRAIGCMDKLERMYMKKRREGMAAKIENMKGKMYENMGRFSLAFEAYKDGLLLARQNHNSSVEAMILLNESKLCFKLGGRDRALAECRRALRIYRKSNDLLGTESALKEMGIMCWEMSNFKQADHYLDEALKLCSEKVTGNSGTTCKHLKKLIFFLNMEPEGREDIAVRIKNHTNDPLILAYYYLKTGNTYRAKKFYKIALKTAKKIYDYNAIFTSYLGLGISHRIEGHYQKSEVYLKKAIKINEDIRRALPVGKRLFFLSEKVNGFRRIEAYENLVRTMILENKVDRAYKVSEYSKARLLLDIIGSRYAISPTIRMRCATLMNFVRIASVSKNDMTVFTASLIKLINEAVFEGYYGDYKKARDVYNKLQRFTQLRSPKTEETLERKKKVLTEIGVKNNFTSSSWRNMGEEKNKNLWNLLNLQR